MAKKSVAELSGEKARVERLVEMIKNEGSLSNVMMSEEFLDHLLASNTVEELKSKAQTAGIPATYIDERMKKVDEDIERVYGPVGVEGGPIEGAEDLTYNEQGGVTGLARGMTEYEQSMVNQGVATPEQIIAEAMGFAGLDDAATQEHQDTSGYIGLNEYGIDPVTHMERVGAPDYSIYGFERTAYTQGTGLPYISNPTFYANGSETAEWAAKSPLNRRYWTKEMEAAGLLQGGEPIGGGGEYADWRDVPIPGHMMGFNTTDQQREDYQREQAQAVQYPVARRYGLLDEISAYREVLGVANYLGVQPEIAVRQIRMQYETAQRLKASSGGGGGYVKAPFSVPAQLRTVPDYETLQQRVTDMMRQTMGRDPEDWEIAALADDMKEKHTQYNEQMIKAYRDAYDGKGRVEDIEVPDPVERTQRFLEERYAPEMGRLEDIDEAAQSNQLMINAITKGAQMVGGR